MELKFTIAPPSFPTFSMRYTCHARGEWGRVKRLHYIEVFLAQSGGREGAQLELLNRTRVSRANTWDFNGVGRAVVGEKLNCRSLFASSISIRTIHG